jgi:hypothetical protein
MIQLLEIVRQMNLVGSLQMPNQRQLQMGST